MIHINALISIYMPSVFSVHPPSFSQKEAIEILHQEFGLSGKTQELYSERDQNFIVQTDSKSKYILKIFNPAEDRSVLDLQHAATQFIKERDPELGVPLQVGGICEITKGSHTFFLRLVEYLDGQFMKDTQIKNTDYLKTGQFLGRLSHALAGFQHPGAMREFAWDVQPVHLIRERLQILKSENDRCTVSHFLDEYETNVIPIADKLRLAVIHNDGNDHNILVNEKGETTGIIDFGDMVHSYQALEPAVCMAYMALEKNDPVAVMAPVLKGYHSCFPLNDAELKSTLYLSCVRLCITVTMAAWRKTLYPDNEYLTVSENAAWTLLKSMERENLSDWSCRLMEYAK